MTASLNDIAKVAKCSVSSISRVLNGGNATSTIRISKETRQRILNAAKALNYHPNRTAEFLRKGFSPVIGVFLPFYRDGLIVDIIKGISVASAKHGFSCSFHFGFSVEEYEQFLHWTVGQKECGIITYPHFKTNNKVIEKLREFLDNDGKLVQLCSAQSPVVIPGYDTPCVICDDYRGGQLAAQRLVLNKCDDYVVIYGDAARGKGFTDVMLGKKRNVIELNATEEGFARALELCLRKKKTTGFFCTNAFDTLKLYSMLLKKGIVPGAKKVKIISYDNTLPDNGLLSHITTIVQPFEEAGECAVNTLLDGIYGNRMQSATLSPVIFDGETA